MVRLFKCCFAVAFLVIVSAVLVVYVLNPRAMTAFFSNNIKWHRDHENQMTIARGVVAYYNTIGRFPDSISQMVESGYLPKKAKFFASPYRHESSDELEFSASSYRFVSPSALSAESYFIARIDDPPEMKMENGSSEVDAFIEKEIAKIEKTDR